MCVCVFWFTCMMVCMPVKVILTCCLPFKNSFSLAGNSQIRQTKQVGHRVSEIFLFPPLPSPSVLRSGLCYHVQFAWLVWFIFFTQVLGFDSGPHSCMANTLPTEPSTQSRKLALGNKVPSSFSDPQLLDSVLFAC